MTGSKFLASAAWSQPGDPVMFRTKIYQLPFRGTTRWMAKLYSDGIKLQAMSSAHDLWVTVDEDGGVSLQPSLIGAAGLRQTWRLLDVYGRVELQSMYNFKRLTYKPNTDTRISVELKTLPDPTGRSRGWKSYPCGNSGLYGLFSAKWNEYYNEMVSLVSCSSKQRQQVRAKLGKGQNSAPIWWMACDVEFHKGWAKTGIVVAR